MKFPFFNKVKNKQETFLGLFLKEEEGIAMLMTKDEEQIHIKEKTKFKYTNGWENLTDDVDEVLYQLEKKQHLEVSKTILFVYSHLVDDNTSDIKKPYLLKIKGMIKNLELEAMGYIECYEAVTFYLEKKEETPLTAVLLELDINQLSLFVYKGGKIHHKFVLARTDNIIDDFTLAIEGLKEKKLLLPSRIIIYDSDKIDDVAAKIIGHKWDDDHFVQIPRIEILKEDDVINGLIQVFSGQTKAPLTEVNQSFGFVIGEDIKNIENKEPNLEPIQEPIFLEEKIEKKNNLNLIPKLPQFPKFSLPKINLSFLKGKTAVFLGIIIIILSLFLNEYFFHKAKLTVYLPSQVIEKNLNESVNYETANSVADFTETVATSGKKQIGDKSKGSVTVHNFDDKEKTFSKGTVFEASGIKYLLDNDVKIASSTLTADGSAKLPGKSNTSITSQDIGPEGNLSKGIRFKIDDQSMNLYFAINESALTGGSRKEIRTVSSDDVDSLEKNILNKAKKNSKSPAFSKNEAIVADLSETEFINKKYSKEVGEESDSVTLTAKTKITYYAYNKILLTDLLLKELKKEVKSGFLINKENLTFKIEQSEKNKNKVDLEINTKAKAIPEFDKEEVLNKIIGKNQKQLETILKSEFKVQGYDIVIKEPLPLLNNYLPFFDKNISLNISSL